jgi:hypothetical protein
MQEMTGLQDIIDRKQNQAALQDNQARLDQMYGYNPEMMDEQQKKWWQNFLQFLRESKERDMARYRQQMV